MIVSEPKHKLWGGERIECAPAPDEGTLSSLPEAIALNIVHEDETLIVLDKPAGLVVHPGNGNASGAKVTPPLMSFDQICNSATATPQPTAQASAAPGGRPAMCYFQESGS